MNIINFNSEQCLRVRRQLDAYLSNELLVETTAEILRHLENCPGCRQALEARAKVREALRRAVERQEVPHSLRRSILDELGKQQTANDGGSRRLSWALAFVLVLVFGALGVNHWRNVERSRQVVGSVLKIGVADHIQCAIRGHNYPDIANPPDKLREKLGPQYAGLLAIVQQKLPGFEVLEAHICSIPGSPRQYIHFITRGRGTILSVILTKANGVQLPGGGSLKPASSSDVRLYEAHVDNMNAAGFEAAGYLGFVVSDLSPAATLELASKLAPPLKDALEATAHSQACLMPFLDRIGR